MTEYVEKETEQAKLLASLWQTTPAELVATLPRGQVELSYLGHADTCRLIAAVDPYWQWSPKGGWTENGEPVFIRDQSGYPTALWIDLTVCGITRPGIGTVARGKQDPEKELIGDAIRNAAMRFGVGADLWSKAKGHDPDDKEGTYARGQRHEPPASPAWDDEAMGWTVAEEQAWRESYKARAKQLDTEDRKFLKETREEMGWNGTAPVPKRIADSIDAVLDGAPESKP